MVFCKKPQSLKQARVLIREAVKIVHDYNQRSEPKQTSLECFLSVERELWSGVLQMGSLRREIEQKLRQLRDKT